MSLFAELKRRNVVRTAVTYIVVSWLLIQVGNTLFTTLDLDTSARKLLFAILILGFIPAVIFSWAYEITPEGIKHEREIERDEAYTNLTAKKLDIITIVLVILAMLMFAYDRLTRTDQIAVHDSINRLSDTQVNSDANVEPESGITNTTSSENKLPSIAVLAFDNMSQDKENSYFSDGISEEILNALVKVNGLRVVARSSSFAYKGQHPDLREIGEKLNAGHVLEGSVRRAGDTVRITAQLINTADGFHLWSEVYNRKLDDIFTVQEEIAKAIVDALRINLMADSDVGKVATTNIEAYDLYLQGRAKLREASLSEDYQAAVALFDTALSLDANFAEAHAGRCDGFTKHYLEALETNLIDLAISACSQAQSLDPDAPQVLISKGELYLAQGKHELALETFKAALAIRPNDARALRGQGETYSELGDFDAAVKSLSEAISIQPDEGKPHGELGVIYFNNSEFELAARHFLSAIQLQPDNDRHYSNLGGVYFYMGEFGKAAEAFRQSIALAPNPNAYSNAGTNHYYQGDYDAAFTMFQQAAELNPSDNLFQGNLADTCRWIARCKQKAESYYQRARQLAEQQLIVNPNDSVIIGQLAAYLARLGLHDEAKQKLQVALQMNPESPEIFYSAALIAHARNDSKAATNYVKNALKYGYPEKAMQSDPDLKDLIDK